MAGVALGKKPRQNDQLVRGPVLLRRYRKLPRRSDAATDLQFGELLPPTERPKRMIAGCDNRLALLRSQFEHALATVRDHVGDPANA